MSVRMQLLLELQTCTTPCIMGRPLGPPPPRRMPPPLPPPRRTTFLAPVEKPSSGRGCCCFSCCCMGEEARGAGEDAADGAAAEGMSDTEAAADALLTGPTGSAADDDDEMDRGNDEAKLLTCQGRPDACCRPAWGEGVKRREGIDRWSGRGDVGCRRQREWTDWGMRLQNAPRPAKGRSNSLDVEMMMLASISWKE